MKKTQLQQVADILEVEGEITNWRAIDSRLTTRLSDKIFKLREAGWKISAEMDGKNCIYRLIEKPAPKQLVIHNPTL